VLGFESMLHFSPRSGQLAESCTLSARLARLDL
jgi:hypothetical protein